MSHDLLDDLLADVPRHVTADPDAAWRSGTRRRRGRYAAEGLAVTVAVALLGLGLVELHDRTLVQPAGSRSVDGYPAHVPRPISLDDLPARPGPLAGGFSSDEGDEWAVVSATGRAWRLPGIDGDHLPALSADGRWLALLEHATSPDATFVLRDLAGGTRVEVPGFAGDLAATDARYLATPQTPGFWSPDDRRLLLYGTTEAGAGRFLLADTRGGVTPIKGFGHPVGWVDEDRLLWLVGTTLVTTDDRGDRLGRVLLEGRAEQSDRGQWAASLAPDGSRVAVLHGSRLTTYSTATGARTATVTLTRPPSDSLPQWQGNRALVWDDRGLVDPAGGGVVVAVSSRWSTYPFTDWASGALAGQEHEGPGVLAVEYWSLWWDWPWLMVAAVGLVAATAWITLRRRARPPTPGAPSPPSAG